MYAHFQKIYTILFSIISLGILACSGNSQDYKEIEPPKKAKYETSKFVMGIDLSYVNAVIDHGGKFLNQSGNETEVYQYLSDEGANVVRVRLWHTPDWQNALYGSIKYSHLTDVTNTIRKAKDAGMKVNLDLHYSDDWADPAKQATPKAWQNANLEVLKDSIYKYTYAVLQHLKNQNLTPEYIQVGNENNGGMCFPIGKINNNNFTNFGQLLTSGIKAVRDFSQTSDIKPQIILHVAQLQNADFWVNGVMNNAGITDFDILGLSHYYLWSDVNTMQEITTKIKDLTAKTGKEVMIVETAFPWTTNNADNYGNIISGTNLPSGYQATKNGQLKYMKELTQAVIDGGGKGVMYWEPCWISSKLKDQWGTGSSWDNNTFFDFTGKPLPVIDYMTAEYRF